MSTADTLGCHTGRFMCDLRNNALEGAQCARGKVVALAAMSRPAKLIAYELGYSESGVSKTLARAMKKLGVRSRAELIEVYGALRDR